MWLIGSFLNLLGKFEERRIRCTDAGNMQVASIPSTTGAAVTPSDSTTVDFSSLYVGGAGNVTLMLYDDVAPITLIAPPVGTLISGLRIKRVMATGTTATLLVGFN